HSHGGHSHDHSHDHSHKHSTATTVSELEEGAAGVGFIAPKQTYLLDVLEERNRRWSSSRASAYCRASHSLAQSSQPYKLEPARRIYSCFGRFGSISWRPYCCHHYQIYRICTGRPDLHFLIRNPCSGKFF